MKHPTITSRLAARLKGTCYIQVDGNGTVSGDEAPITVVAGGEPTAAVPTQEVSSEGAPRDPGAPPETEEEKAARLAKETPEEKAAREAAEAEAAAKPEEKAEEKKDGEETPEEKAAREAAEVEAKNKAWTERDKSKDVPVSEEQKAEIVKLAKTPEQIAAMEEFTLETNTTGDLSPASRAKAAELWNVPPAMVDNYVASVIAQNQAAKQAAEGDAAQYDNTSDDPAKWSPEMKAAFQERLDAVHAVAGGEKNWNEFAEWANANLSAGDKTALQAAIEASPVVGAQIAKGFIAKWKAEGNGGGPDDLSRGAGLKTPSLEPAVKGFATKAEQNAAIRDPRFNTDPAYRKAVEARIIASNFSTDGGNAGVLMV